MPGDEIHPDEIDFKSGSTQNTEDSHAVSLTDEFSREELNAILWSSLSSEPETFEVESYWNRHDVNLDLNARESSSPFRDEPYSIPSQELLDKIKALFEEYKVSRQREANRPRSYFQRTSCAQDSEHRRNQWCCTVWVYHGVPFQQHVICC